MNNFSLSFNRNPFIIFWLSIFFMAVAVSLIFQLILLPYFFPWLHAGNGLVAGYDWIGFHQDAAEIAKQIQLVGWSSWHLHPAPYGFVSPIYALTVSEPFMIIPLNAALHATAGVTLMHIARFLTNDDFTAMCVALPFVLFPSAVVWYAQIHKESFFIAGMFLCLYGWIAFVRIQTWKGSLFLPLIPICLIFFGCLLIWIVRPYGVKLMQGIGVIFALILLPLFFWRGMQRLLTLQKVLLAILVVLALPLALGIYKNTAITHGPEIVSPGLLENSGYSQRADRYADRIKWRSTNWLPGAVDDLFFTLSVTRVAYADSKGASNIDSGIIFSSVSDFFVYLPRAMQIGFLSPFPKLWLEDGSSKANTLVRRIAGVEMLVVYLALLFAPYAFWLYRKKFELWMMVGFCYILLMIYAYTMPNIGTLYRTRYGFLMPIVGIGIAGMITFWRNYCNDLRLTSK